MTDPIAIGSCIQCPTLIQYQTTQMISLDYVSTFELGPFSANNTVRYYTAVATQQYIPELSLSVHMHLPILLSIGYSAISLVQSINLYSLLLHTT